LLRNDPLQNRLHCGKSGIIGLSNNREQLKPQVVVRSVKEFPNRSSHKIRHLHRCRRRAMLDLSCHIRLQRLHDAVRDIRTMELCDQFSQHGASLLLSNFLD
jgi:hypothetical protein